MTLRSRDRLSLFAPGTPLRPGASSLAALRRVKPGLTEFNFVGTSLSQLQLGPGPGASVRECRGQSLPVSEGPGPGREPEPRGRVTGDGHGTAWGLRDCDSEIDADRI
eukprot:3143847-Rhodomonas_salina.1